MKVMRQESWAYMFPLGNISKFWDKDFNNQSKNQYNWFNTTGNWRCLYLFSEKLSKTIAYTDRNDLVASVESRNGNLSRNPEPGMITVI